MVEGRAVLRGRTEEEVVHLPLLISLVEVTCRGWRGPLGQQIEEVYAIKNRRGGGNKSPNLTEAQRALASWGNE